MAVYRLPAVKKKQQKKTWHNTQRIHRLIPLSDFSLIFTLPVSWEHTPSISFFPCLNPLFSLLLLYTAFSLSPHRCVPEWLPGHHFHPTLCFCQRACLYCNGIPAVDKCQLCSLFPIDRNERKGETSDWSARVPLTHFPHSLVPSLQIHFLSLTQHLTIWTESTADYVRMPGKYTILYM